MAQIIVRPVLTEKSLALSNKGWYTFAVSLGSRKENIAEALNALYKIEVTMIRTIAVHGKSRRVGKRAKSVAKPNWKKALVRLKDGQSIDAFQVGGEPAGAK